MGRPWNWVALLQPSACNAGQTRGGVMAVKRQKQWFKCNLKFTEEPVCCTSLNQLILSKITSLFSLKQPLQGYSLSLVCTRCSQVEVSYEEIKQKLHTHISQFVIWGIFNVFSSGKMVYIKARNTKREKCDPVT